MNSINLLWRTVVVIIACHNYIKLNVIKSASIGDKMAPITVITIIIVISMRHFILRQHHLCTASFPITVYSPHTHLFMYNTSTADADAGSFANTVANKYHVVVTVTKGVWQESSLQHVICCLHALGPARWRCIYLVYGHHPSWCTEPGGTPKLIYELNSWSTCKRAVTPTKCGRYNIPYYGIL